MTTQQLEHEHTAAAARAINLTARLQQAAAAEGRDLGAGERSAINEATATANQLKARIERARADQGQLDAIDRLTAAAGVGSAAAGYSGSSGSLGEQLLASETGRYLIEKRGQFPSGAWVSPASELQAAVLTGDSASGGALVVSDYRPGILQVPTRRLVVADLIAPGTTDSNSVTYMKETLFTNAAAPVLEAGIKPESTLTFTSVTDPVVKIAHWLPITEEMLEDVPALRSFLEARLRLGVLLREDESLLNGTGVAPELRGLLQRAGLAAPIARGTDSNADAVLRQIAAIQTATGTEVSGIVMHPSNWISIQLLKDTSGAYVAGNGPFSAPQAPTLWGIPVSLTPTIALGTALVGAFKTAAQLFRKGGLRVEASNSHQDFFIKNLVAIRAEERLALAVYRPSAFGTVTGLL